eukprot:TRINITY_DN9163_c0_g1_i4.p2 TRINITY_DN9163_c0_g1~~TRINITY_DN9163_c0_g1_i4.p2  ORF type:complete len:236 (-),score=35.45 TRINITY_DN9163_c0_g1_i4:202-909(-)
MGRGIESSVLNGIRNVNISHQEMDRVLKALEEMYTETKANAPQLEWMPVVGVGNLLAHELGYEDTDEFEDALGSTFHEFISNFPIIEVKPDDRFTGGHVFKVKPDPPESEWEPTKHTFRVRNGQDLWRTCHKSRHARLCVPSLEFEIQADGQRHIDALYNHIGNAITNLAAYASQMGPGMGNDTKVKILETVEALEKLLDVPEPWDVVVYDPSGVSEITPDTDVAIERYDPKDET